MKWLKTMSKDELREAYEKVTNEEDLQEFENHCQEIGIQIHRATKELHKKGVTSPESIVSNLFLDDGLRDAMETLVNHSLKMMDK